MYGWETIKKGETVEKLLLYGGEAIKNEENFKKLALCMDERRFERRH